MTYSVLVCILHIPEIHIRFSFSNLILPNVRPSESYCTYTVANLIMGGSCLMYGQSLNPSHVGGLAGIYPALFHFFWGDGDYAIHESMGSTVWYIFPDL